MTTPLDLDATAGLIPTHLVTQGALIDWERANILAAEKWAFARRRTDVLSIEFVLDLHGRMFGDTWTWAGTIRSSETDVGVPVAQIRPELQKALADVKHWTEQHAYRPDERAVRFHQRLTQIHAFPHGNGRHARLMTDVLLFNLGRPRFSWAESGLRPTRS